MSAGGNKSTTSSGQQSQNNSFLDPFQQQQQQNMIGQALQFMNPAGAQNAVYGAERGNVQYGQQARDRVAGLGDPSGQIAAQDASLQEGLGQLFRNEIAPSIQGNAIAAGGLGGGRQGVAEGQAAGDIASAYAQARGDIVARANQGALQANSMIPGFNQSIAGSAGNAFSGGMDMLGMFGQLLGQPQTLSQGSASSNNTQKSSGFNFGLFPSMFD